MGIKPIDLQVNFSQMHHVGKEQAAAKQGLAVSQEVKGSELAEKTLKEDEKVNKTRDTEDGTVAVKEKRQEDPGAEAHQNHDHEHESKQKDETTMKDKRFSIVQDPDLGRNIDLKG